MKKEITEFRAPLTTPAQALESSRDSGFDLSAAVGELVDNSFEAKANHIRIASRRDEHGSIVDLAVADDGVGIEPHQLAYVLSLGFSTRYGSRSGLGRFGMGLKLASLSHARRVEVYTRPLRQQRIYCCYLDLEEVQRGYQKDLLVEEVSDWPADCAELALDPETGVPFESGTMVVWRKIDRIQSGGRFAASIDERLQDLTKFLARAYRKFIDKGLRIELEGCEITLHDPLFLLDNPRVVKRCGKDLHAEVIQQSHFDLDGHRVDWVITLLPKEFRRVQGRGARASKNHEEFADLYIPDNEGKVSILRNGREIYYEIIPKLWGGVTAIDRFIGVEISFPAALDEYFQVRNVKRGAEPVRRLRDQLRKVVRKPVEEARERIRAYWVEFKNETRAATGDQHLPAHGAVDAFERTAPAGRANRDVTDDDIQRQLSHVVLDMGFDAASPEGIAATNWVRESFEKRALTVVDSQWPGKDLLEITHLSGKAIVKMNNRHPFMSEVILPLKGMAAVDPEELTAAEVSSLLKKLDTTIDLLFLGYAKAENMHAEPEKAYGELRTHWGLYAGALVREALRQAG